MANRRDEITDLIDALYEAQSQLEEAVTAIRQAAKLAESIGGLDSVDRRLELYAARNVEAFIDGEHQMGSIGSEIRALEELLAEGLAVTA